MKALSKSESDSNLDPPPFHLWQCAAELAATAHSGQTTPETEVPYFSHSARVAMLVAGVFGCCDPKVIAAAFLHDVLEKTSLNKADLSVQMGETVTDWVAWLSKNEKREMGSYWERLAGAPWEVRLIKMADALDHLNGPPQFRSERLKTARKALTLATTAEPEIGLAAASLEKAIASLAKSR